MILLHGKSIQLLDHSNSALVRMILLIILLKNFNFELGIQYFDNEKQIWVPLPQNVDFAR